MYSGIRKKIGVLALQGAFQLHQKHVEGLGAEYKEVVGSQDFSDIDALILPGGESGTMLKLISLIGIADELSAFMKAKPVWGICAGAILMAKSVRNPTQRSFGVIDIEVERNSYGRQCDSFEAVVCDYQVSYIRAPKIISVGPHIEVLNRREGCPTWVEAGHLMVTTFHPETSAKVPSPWHQRLLSFTAPARELLIARGRVK